MRAYYTFNIKPQDLSSDTLLFYFFKFSVSNGFICCVVLHDPAHPHQGWLEDLRQPAGLCRFLRSQQSMQYSFRHCSINCSYILALVHLWVYSKLFRLRLFISWNFIAKFFWIAFLSGRSCYRPGLALSTFSRAALSSASCALASAFIFFNLILT